MEKSATTRRCVWLAVIFTLMSGVVGDCHINFTALHKNHAMFLNLGGSDMIYPNADGEVIITQSEFGSGNKIRCPGTENRFVHNRACGGAVTCDNGTLMYYDDFSGIKVHENKDDICSLSPTAIMKEEGSCLNDKTLYKVGFEWDENSFFTLYQVCAEYQKVHYVKQTLKKERLLAQESYSGDESFITDEIFTDEIYEDSTYCKESEKSITSQLGGDTTLYEKLFGNGGFITPGQLTGRENFCYRAEQQSTYYLSNYQPQWNKLKNNNWALLEKSIREMVKAGSDSVDVYTGTFGQLRAIRDGRNSRNESVALTLNDNVTIPAYFWKIVDSLFSYSAPGTFGQLRAIRGGRSESVALTLNDNVPIPAIFWKVVYDNDRGKGVAFIGHNSIANRLNNITCNDESGRLDWLTPNVLRDFKVKERGTIFVCSIRSFLSVVKIKLPQDVRVGEIF